MPLLHAPFVPDRVPSSLRSRRSLASSAVGGCITARRTVCLGVTALPHRGRGAATLRAGRAARGQGAAAGPAQPAGAGGAAADAAPRRRRRPAVTGQRHSAQRHATSRFEQHVGFMCHPHVSLIVISSFSTLNIVFVAPFFRLTIYSLRDHRGLTSGERTSF